MQMAKVFLTDATKSTCSLCMEYLSVGPVMMSTNKPVCGRCHAPNGVRAEFYETLAKYMVFPCKNDKYGCDVTCSWGKVQLHEGQCIFSPMYCPAYGCEERITKENVLEHFKTKHEHLIMQNSEYFVVPLNDKHANSNINILYLWKNKPFILKIRYIKGNCFCELTTLETSPENRLYDLLIQDYKKNRLFKLSQLNICNYINKDDILEKMKLDIKNLSSIMENANKIICTVVIQENKLTENDWNTKLLNELECPVCFVPMRPPIYGCKIGHSICQSCILKMRECPTCKNELNRQYRNYSLEKISDLVVYSCGNIENGCRFQGKLSEINNHEILCKSHVYTCYLYPSLRCSWKGPEQTIFLHMMFAHYDYFFKNGKTISVTLESNDRWRLFWTLYNNLLFVVHINFFKGGGIRVLPKVITKSQQATSEKYSCYFNFVNNKDKILTVNKDCIFTETNDNNMQYFLHLNPNSISPFVDRNITKIRINIVNI